MRKGKSKEFQELWRERKTLMNWDAVNDELLKNNEDRGIGGGDWCWVRVGEWEYQVKIK